jgi:hypothetical protein
MLAAIRLRTFSRTSVVHQQAAAKGEMLEELAVLRARYPAVLSASRGKGLLVGLEFPSDAVGYDCAAALFRRGVLVAGTYSKARTIRIEPALDVPSPLLLEVLNRLEDAFKEIQTKRFGSDRCPVPDVSVDRATVGNSGDAVWRKLAGYFLSYLRTEEASRSATPTQIPRSTGHTVLSRRWRLAS